MKIATHNSILKSFVTGKAIHSTFEFRQDNVVKRSEKIQTKGLVKFFLAIFYFAVLMYSLFILLT